MPALQEDLKNQKCKKIKNIKMLFALKRKLLF